MDKKESVRNEIAQILGKTVGEVSDDTSFSNMGVDSFALINMIIELQETFKIRLNQEDLVTVHTIGALLDLIASRMK